MTDFATLHCGHPGCHRTLSIYIRHEPNVGARQFYCPDHPEDDDS